jgi:hypothetical protein
MHKPALLAISYLILLSATAQTSAHLSPPRFFQARESSVYYSLGERNIQVKIFQYGNARDKVYINLHDDEMTAINGAKKLLEKKGGYLIKIENYRTRNIRFKLDGKYYTIDPNRMFSRIGIQRSLIIFGNTSPKAVDEIEKFANHILQMIPANPSWIIALHNNTNGKYSINSYMPGGDKEKDAKEFHVNQELDADDFFLTTDSVLYDRLAAQKYNTIWQDNEKAKKDGSLSIYCGERNIHYVNCETEHGRQPEYDEMIAVAVNDVEEKGPEMKMNAINKPEPQKSELTVPSNKPETKKPDVVVSPNKIENKNPGTPVTTKRSASKRSGMMNPVNNIENKNPDVIAYNYCIPLSTHSFSLKPNTDILFGEKKVGAVRSVLSDSSKTITGKFEMNKDFALYSNMDFFLFVSAAASPRLEVRIDPTRKKEPVNPQFSTIAINTRAVN